MWRYILSSIFALLFSLSAQGERFELGAGGSMWVSDRTKAGDSFTTPPKAASAVSAHIGGQLGSLGGSSVTTNTVTYSPTAGNDTVVCIMASHNPGGQTTNLLSSVSDGTNTYTIVLDSTVADAATGHNEFAIAEAHITGTPTVVTATYSSAVAFPQLGIDEYSHISGVDLHAGAKQTTPGTATDAITSTATGTTTQAIEMLYGCSVNFAGTSTTETNGTGYTKRLHDVTGADWGMITEDQRVTSTGAQSATFTDATQGGNSGNAGTYFSGITTLKGQ